LRHSDIRTTLIDTNATDLSLKKTKEPANCLISMERFLKSIAIN